MSVIGVHPFTGCCGARIWYFSGSADPKAVEESLHVAAKQCLGNTGLVACILTASQNNSLEKTMKAFGFLKFCLKGAVNPNSQSTLYGYHYNMNNYGKEKAPKKSAFKG